MTSAAEVVGYYNGFRERLLEDYLYGSPRIEAALRFAKGALGDATTVLDVGCGIGWTSSELAKLGYKVTGMDISPVLITTARERFSDCDFMVDDFVTAELPQSDAVLMVDVYEHFAREQRSSVHEQICRTQAQRIIVTVPTIATQEYARANNIALQIIDEDVSELDVWRLAAGVEGRIVVNRTVSIYRANDYRHVLIER